MYMYVRLEGPAATLLIIAGSSCKCEDWQRSTDKQARHASIFCTCMAMGRDYFQMLLAIKIFTVFCIHSLVILAWTALAH